MFTIKCDGTSVDVCMCDEGCDYMSSFLTLYLLNDEALSPFKSIEELILFAEVIVKLLELIKGGDTDGVC